MSRKLVLLCLLCAVAPGAALAHDGNPANQLVEYKHTGAWEVWCIDMGGTGRVVCDLNQVLRYQDHPDFRALILRFYYDTNGLKMVIEHEWQTSLARGYIQVDHRPPVALADCGRPCTIRGDRLTTLVDEFSTIGTSPDQP